MIDKWTEKWHERFSDKTINWLIKSDKLTVITFCCKSLFNHLVLSLVYVNNKNSSCHVHCSGIEIHEFLINFLQLFLTLYFIINSPQLLFFFSYTLLYMSRYFFLNKHVLTPLCRSASAMLRSLNLPHSRSKNFAT